MSEQSKKPKREFYYFIKPESNTKDVITRLEYLTYVVARTKIASERLRGEIPDSKDIQVLKFGGTEKVRLLIKYYNLHQLPNN